MKKRRSIKLTFWLIGLGTGMIISGIIGAVCTLNIKEYRQMLFTHHEETRKETSSPVADTLASPKASDMASPSADQVQSPLPTLKNELPAQSPQTDEKQVLDEGKLVSKNETQDTISVYIPEGYNSKQVCEFLEQYQVIDNADAFNKYIIAQGKTKRLTKGYRTLPRHGDYEEILGIIAVK